MIFIKNQSNFMKITNALLDDDELEDDELEDDELEDEDEDDDEDDEQNVVNLDLQVILNSSLFWRNNMSNKSNVSSVSINSVGDTLQYPVSPAYTMFL